MQRRADRDRDRSVGCPLQLAGQSKYDPDQPSRAEQSTEPVDPASRLSPRPQAESNNEDPATDVVGRATGGGSDAPSGER